MPISLRKSTTMCGEYFTCFLCHKQYNHTGIATHLRRTHKVKMPVRNIKALTPGDQRIIKAWTQKYPNEEIDVPVFKTTKYIVNARYFIVRHCRQPVPLNKCERHCNMSILRNAFKTLEECKVPYRTDDEIDALEALIELKMS